MTMAMELIRHIAGLYSGKAIKGDFTQVYITGNEIWMAQQVLAEQAEGAQEREALPHWPPCNPACDPELNGFRDRRCSCAQARAALAQPSPAPELERPEVVAWMWRDINGDIQFNYMHPEGEPLMTVAQHERIVTAWRHLKDVKYAELYEEAVQLEAKIDAAQAKLAELERQEPVYTKPSWADSYGWSGGYIDFKCATDVEKLARHFEDLLDAVPEGPLYAAPVAQAGQVPEELREAVEWADHLLFECGALVQTRAPSVHVYNKAFAAIEAAKTLLAGAPAKGE